MKAGTETLRYRGRRTARLRHHVALHVRDQHKKLEKLKAKHPSVGDVRGKGLFWGVDLVKTRKTKEPFNTYADKVSGKPLLVDQIAAKTLADGVILQAWISHFVIAPPLIITREEIDRGIDVLDTHLQIADAQCVGD